MCVRASYSFSTNGHTIRGLVCSPEDQVSLRDIYHIVNPDEPIQECAYILQTLWTSSLCKYRVLGPYFEVLVFAVNVPVCQLS
jgi:hypothetical protein